MTQDAPAPAAPPPVMADPAAVDFAALLAARLCHDFISPASAVVSGLNLLDDPTAQDMREEAMSLIASSARKLVAHLAFARVAFGASAAAETFDVRDLEALTRGVFEHVRPELEWSISVPTLNKPAARALLNIAQLGAGALPTGGLARVAAYARDSELLMGVESTGGRARLRPEVAAGLDGLQLAEGMAGQWVQALYVHMVLTAAGGRVEHMVADGKVVIRARVPL